MTADITALFVDGTVTAHDPRFSTCPSRCVRRVEMTADLVRLLHRRFTALPTTILTRVTVVLSAVTVKL